MFISAPLLCALFACAQAKCCSRYSIGGKCCNVFGCKCEGPCWNAGCRTTCPPKRKACPGNDRKYNCCSQDSPKCRPSSLCAAGERGCCCKGTQKTIIEFTEFQWDVDNVKMVEDATATKLAYSYKASNYGSKSSPVGSVSFSVTETQDTTITTGTSTSISASTTVNTGVPFVANGQVEFSIDRTWTYDSAETRSVAIEVTIESGSDEIPPYSNQEFRFNSEMFIARIPFKATAIIVNDCEEQSTEAVIGSASVSGVASFAEGQFTKVIGPAIPMECEAPWKIPIALQSKYSFCMGQGTTCASNTLCERYQIMDGDCCPKQDGEYSPCCAAAGGHPDCSDYPPETLLCPTEQGKFHPCCSGGKDILSDENISTEHIISAHCGKVRTLQDVFGKSGTPKSDPETTCKCVGNKCSNGCANKRRKCKGPGAVRCRRTLIGDLGKDENVAQTCG